MPVVNNNLARRESFNGRLDVERDENEQAINPGRLIQCELLPGLNTVTEDEARMLRENKSFEIYEAAGDIEIVDHDESGAEAPEDVTDIDITGMSVKKAGKMLTSVATIELLDMFEKQERDGAERVGVLALINKHRVRVQELIDAQQSSGDE